MVNLDISILVPGLPIGPETLETESLGGAESAGIYMARALARTGCSVSVFCNTTRSWADRAGVRYLPQSAWQNFALSTPHDVCIVQRAADMFAHRTNARLNVLWCHDLALGRHERAFREPLWGVDRVLVISNFMRDQYRQAYKLHDESFFVSRNGVDLELFRELRREGIERDRKKLMFCARPERGLDLLLGQVMPKLLARDRELRLHVARYDDRPSDLQDFYATCSMLARALGDRVVDLGCLSKRELYRHLLSAGVYVFPTPSPAFPTFREVSCISAMECQAAGLPIVTTSIGALPETIAPGAGRLIDADPAAPSGLDRYVREFTEGVLEFVNDDPAWLTASDRGRERADDLDWSDVARDWLTEFERLIRAANDCPERLVRHFYRTSDIMAAKHVLARSDASVPPGPRRDALTKLLEPWAFMDRPDGYRETYERTGHLIDDSVYEQTLTGQRFALLDGWLGERAGSIRTMLDYGCAHGAFAVGLAQRHRGLRVHGTDIDRFSVARAQAWAAKNGIDERVTFSVWTHDSSEPIGVDLGKSETFDCALLQEVLEHVPEPWHVLTRVERGVRRGGTVYITVPFGPWEFAVYRSLPDRHHIWHLDAHDLFDMLGSKQNLAINPVHAGDNPLTGEAQGWWIATYTADHEPIPPIDIERHCWLQRPRQTLSVAIIAGPDAEETLHWTLRSVQVLADEIVIADCGMNEEALRIAKQYDSRIVQGVDPKLAGFDRARNMSLDACSSDWCLWIDTDEKLVGSELLTKYLRENLCHAYGITQHNFACDETVKLATPLRLFRRRPFQDRSVRFWGAIHEQAAFGVDDGAGPSLALGDVHIAHLGYLLESGRRARLARNWPLLQLDQERHPERLLQKYFIMRDTLHMVRYAMERRGGSLDDGLRAKCREVIELYRRYFLGTRHAAKNEALTYYSHALLLLDEGFEAAFQIEADKIAAEPNGVRRYRFASSDDLFAELKAVANEKAEHLDSECW